MADKYLDQFAEQIQKFKTKEELKDFLETILTPKELEQIPIRLEIVRQIKQGIAHHKIAEDLKVGIATVTRGSKELKLNHFKNI
ncbi:MAG: Trp family transcriptional regulator [Candidatus Gracilibacteria bacterium]|nr:Trp family transcriptional regulator [Candidatus Gracilibacteria bacterium]MDD3119857.1 Trp family transcriptional regulator [Candidatus Gracilibacteria bacterium]MDD4530046.1 Trp family transcriptional regulator [Candidatus Gracilibacteria bacterium]